MMKNAHIAASLAIVLLGLALVLRSVMVNGTIVLSTNIIAGVAFIIYGVARFYYLKRA